MENQRVRMSKQLLKNALIAMLPNTAIEKVTVRELCQQAQVNRTTFYKYYASPYDLLHDLENDYFANLQQCLSNNNDDKETLHNVLTYLNDNSREWRLLLNTVQETDISERLFRLPDIESMVLQHLPENLQSTMKEYAMIFFCSGGYAIIKRWLNATPREDPCVIAEMIYAFAYGFLFHQ